jgi:hypothetical protein
LVVDGVEVSTYVRVQHPIHFLISYAHYDRVECLMLPLLDIVWLDLLFIEPTVYRECR